MSLHLNILNPTTKNDAVQAARNLGNLLAETPEYTEYIAALKALNGDLKIQKLSAEMRDHQAALKWGNDTEGQHTAELTRLELEMQDQPLVQEFQQRENKLRTLLQEVDRVISQEAGVDFAVNAHRRGCACGG